MYRYPFFPVPFPVLSPNLTLHRLIYCELFYYSAQWNRSYRDRRTLCPIMNDLLQIERQDTAVGIFIARINRQISFRYVYWTRLSILLNSRSMIGSTFSRMSLIKFDLLPQLSYINIKFLGYQIYLIYRCQ